jgi:hypothetical protein
MKRRITKVDGQNPWEIEERIWIAKGMSPDSARAFTTNHYMADGDLQPLAAAIRNHLLKGHKLHPATLFLLAEMIDDGQLVKARRRGRPKKPGIFARDTIAFHLYEYSKKSEEEIAALLGMSQESVHTAIIKERKTWWVK